MSVVFIEVLYEDMSRGESPRTDIRPASPSETKQLEESAMLGDDPSDNSTLKGGKIQPLAIHPSHPYTLHKPKPPKEHPNPETSGRLVHPLNQDCGSQLRDDTGPEGLRLDNHRKVLPHSILGSSEDFRSYLEAKEEMNQLVKRIPESPRDPTSEATGRHRSEAVEKDIPSGHRNMQANALQHWDAHMRHRRQQQNLLCDLLDRPVENLLMNQANHFRETQEQRDLLTRVLPLIHSGYGHRVGSEFWSLPQRYGDDMSGIAATLTQTEQGRRETVAHVGQPTSTRQEAGMICAETVRPASRTWNQSAYLQRHYQELREVLLDLDIKQTDISELEVIGKLYCPLLEKEEEEGEHKEMKKENLDALAQDDQVHLDVLLIPALRFCGQLARWTGHAPTNQLQRSLHTGDTGISATIIFEALTGERASSQLELHNEGSTAILYSWQQLPVAQSFKKLHSQTSNTHFYFNSSSGVIRPGDTQRVEFIFKSEEPGIKTELWRLNTRPVLLQGASIQVTLRGVSLYQDRTADQRLFIETKLEEIVVVKMCRWIVNEMLQGVRSPERPSSPAELYITEEQQFLSKNPELQYFDQPVEGLKRLWQEVKPGHHWDLSVQTLRQAVLSLPDETSLQDLVSTEETLAQLNSLILQLSAPPELRHHLTAAAAGQQLWRKLLDTMAAEAVWLRNLLGLPEIDNKDESVISDADLADNANKEEKREKKGGAAAKEEKSGMISRFKDDNKGESKSPTGEKPVEENKKRGKRKDEGRRHSREKSASLIDTRSEISIQQRPDGRRVDPQKSRTYTRLLHRKVYGLMEDLVDNLCDLMDELQDGDEQDTR
ncbi:MYCBP-associated protein isoform X1 [Brachyistius frenatus]|uniref:MYCBP-associated protein isoform X1 n=1 Tax=Brachyistius frenatus TaxID=100188 RepID=UPI0037E80C75